MDLKEFQIKIPENGDVRPFLPDVVHLYTQGNRKAHDSAYGPEGYVIKAVEKETGYWKPPQRRTDRSRKKSTDDELARDYAGIVRAWKRENSTSRGDRNFAVAVFYWFFRYVPESVYFIEIAKKTWPNGSDTFKRFVYAKCGGSEQDDFKAVCDRFKAPIAEVLEAFDRIWISDKPPFKLELPTRSNQLFHYTNDAIEILGREAEQAALERFRDVSPGFRWWQVAGVAGQGKSRLALDLVLKTRNLPEWEAGFLVGESALTAFSDSCEHWVPNKPHLIVIDNFLASLTCLNGALEILAERSSEFDHPVCVLLVERQPWNTGGSLGVVQSKADWFTKLFQVSDGMESSAMRFAFRDEEFSEVLHLHELDSKQLVMICQLVAQKGNRPFVPNEQEIENLLASIDNKGRPLFSYFLGKALGDGELHAAENTNSLLDWVLWSNWSSRWASANFDGTSPAPSVGSAAPNLPGYLGQNPSMHLAILSTILRKLDCNNISGEYEIRGWTPHNDLVLRQAKVIADNPTSPMEEPTVYGLLPDLLGEYFVLESIRRQREFLTLMDLAWSVDPDMTAEFLVRTSRDFSSHEMLPSLLERLPVERNKRAQEAYLRVSAQVCLNLLSETTELPNTLIEAVHQDASSGNTKSMLLLAVCYHRGRGVEQNLVLAFNWYSQGAYDGDGDCMAYLGLCYHYGYGTQKNIDKAVEWYRKSVNTGCGRAMADLGVCYLFGHGVEKNVETAANWFSEGVNAGDGYAMSCLGVCYQHGNGVEQDVDRAFALYKSGALRSNGQAMANLGVCYHHGIGVAADKEAAVYWYQKGALFGSQPAMMTLGKIYEVGVGVQQDKQVALKWYRMAKKAGHPNAAPKVADLEELSVGHK